MALQLQKFSHKLSTYARPNQAWVCGKQAQGYTCESGPDQGGFCRTEYECQPYKEDQGWVCSRSQFYGGSCSDGPLPNGDCCRKISLCQPLRSVRKKRSLLVKWSVLLALAMLLFFLTNPLKGQFFNPGDLSFKHATLTDCTTCHAVYEKSFMHWLAQAFSGNDVLHNSQTCLDCHQFGDNANNAHGLSVKNMDRLMQAEDNRMHKNDKQLACVTCHVEHQGLDLNLTAVAPQNCAFCHQQLDYALIQNQHPAFDRYPYRRKTKIMFDHKTHEKKYYYNRAGDKLLDTAPKSCLSCHSLDVNGKKMLSGFYETDCKACHNDLFEEAESFVVFELPEFAEDSIDLNIEWPRDATGVMSGFMVLLLASDPLFLQAITDVEDYFDLTALNEQQTSLVIIAIKNLFHDVERQGRDAFKQRIAASYQCQLNLQGELKAGTTCPLQQEELDQLGNVFSVQLFCEGKKRWFPKLVANVMTLATTGENYCKKSFEDEKKLYSGEWTIEEYGFYYRPVAHKDNFFKTWLNISRHKNSFPAIEKSRITLFNTLNSDESSIQCTKCHSVESSNGSDFIVNWPVGNSVSAAKEFIKFKHDAHIKYQEESICKDCHVENKEGDYLASYDSFEASEFVSNFTTEREVCLSCHEQSMTKEQCQTCHNYHVKLPLELVQELSPQVSE